MYRITITRENYKKHTIDVKSIFSVFNEVFNCTGDHGLSMDCYAIADKLDLNDIKEISSDKYKIKLEYYETLTISSIENAVNIIKDAIIYNYNAIAVIYNKGPWAITMKYSELTRTVQYDASYRYKTGRHGLITILVENNKLLQLNNNITLPKEVKDKILSTHKALNKSMQA